MSTLQNRCSLYLPNKHNGCVAKVRRYIANDNDNEKHFFSENNVQCYKYIIC